MAKTLLDLAKRLEKKVAVIDKAASDLSVKVAIGIVTNLAFKTPVDTSQALSNWQVGIDMPNGSQIKAHFAGVKGSTQAESIGETINLARAKLKQKKPGEVIVISNNLPYIRKLNDGSSAQEPAGFVERAVLVGRKIVQSNKLGV